MIDLEVRLQNVSMKYGHISALNGLNMLAPDGKITVVVGPSGSGKSTLLRLVAGLEEPLSGKVLFDGKPVHEPPEKRNIGMVFQSLALFPNMTVAGNIAFGLQVRKVPRAEIEERVKEVAKLMGIDSRLDSKPGELSGGQQQRVALARALAPNPRLLLLDEPFSSLDARLRDSLRWEVKHIQQQQKLTVIHVTHDHVEALGLADHLAVINDGALEQEGTARGVVDNPANEFVAWFMGYNSVPYNGGRLCFLPQEAELTEPALAELHAEVDAVQNSPAGFRARVSGDSWWADVETGFSPAIGAKVGLKLKRSKFFKN